MREQRAPSEAGDRLGDRFRDALLYAAEIHAEQVRKGSEVPYISHLLGVTGLVLREEGNEDEAVAALLHDAAEDQGGWARLDDVRRRFGARVADIAEACSEPLENPKPPWKKRKQEYLDRIRTDHDPSALLVSLADKVDNARAILRDHTEMGDDLWERFNAGRDCQLWYHRALVEAYATRTDGQLLRELDEVVTLLEQRCGGPSPGCPDEGGRV